MEHNIVIVYIINENEEHRNVLNKTVIMKDGGSTFFFTEPGCDHVLTNVDVDTQYQLFCESYNVWVSKHSLLERKKWRGQYNFVQKPKKRGLLHYQAYEMYKGAEIILQI